MSPVPATRLVRVVCVRQTVEIAMRWLHIMLTYWKRLHYSNPSPSGEKYPALDGDKSAQLLSQDKVRRESIFTRSHDSDDHSSHTPNICPAETSNNPGSLRCDEETSPSTRFLSG